MADNRKGIDKQLEEADCINKNISLLSQEQIEKESIFIISFLNKDLLSSAKTIRKSDCYYKDDSTHRIEDVFNYSGAERGKIVFSGNSYFLAYNPTEPELTRTLAFFLDSTESHGLGDMVARSFIAAISDCIKQNFPQTEEIAYSDYDYQDFDAYAELSTYQSLVNKDNYSNNDIKFGRMDIVLKFEGKSSDKKINNIIVIECKFDASLDISQLLQYEEWLKLEEISFAKDSTYKATRIFITRGKGCPDIEKEAKLTDWQHITWYQLLKSWSKYFPKYTENDYIINILYGLHHDLWKKGVLG